MKLSFTGDAKRGRFEEESQSFILYMSHFLCGLQSLSLGSSSGKMSLELEGSQCLLKVFPLPKNKRIPYARSE